MERSSTALFPHLLRCKEEFALSKDKGDQLKTKNKNLLILLLQRHKFCVCVECCNRLLLIFYSPLHIFEFCSIHFWLVGLLWVGGYCWALCWDINPKWSLVRISCHRTRQCRHNSPHTLYAGLSRRHREKNITNVSPILRYFGQADASM